MARNIKYQFSTNHLRLDFVNNYYEQCLASIECRYSKDRNTCYDMEFQNMTYDEVREEAEKMKSELEKETMFNWLACIEALLRIDYIVRIDKKFKDPLSCYFRNNYKQSEKQKKKSRQTLEPKKKDIKNSYLSSEKYHVNLCDVIIQGWREYHPEEKICFNLLADMFKFRNWIAHGRYRKFDEENKYEFMMMLSIVEVFRENICPFLKHF